MFVVQKLKSDTRKRRSSQPAEAKGSNISMLFFNRLQMFGHVGLHYMSLYLVHIHSKILMNPETSKKAINCSRDLPMISFAKKNWCIVITGRGHPDVPTRRFLCLLVENLHLPVYCLVDCDPYGFDILTTYKFGSMQMAYDAKHLRVPEIRWLGVFPSESEKYCLPKECLLPLTGEDKIKVEAMSRRRYLQQETPEWRFELEMPLQRGIKFEIEALSANNLTFLSYAASSWSNPCIWREYDNNCVQVYRIPRNK